MELLDSQHVLEGEPDTVLAQARELSVVADNIDDLAGLLDQLDVAAVWTSPAGDRFTDALGDEPSAMRAVARRLRGAAVVLDPYSGRLRDAQEAIRRHERSFGRSEDRVRDCDRRLEGIEAGSPEHQRVLDERREAAEAADTAMRRHQDRCWAAIDDELDVAAALGEVSDALTDPRGYDVFEGVSAIGRSWIFTNPLTAVVKPARAGTALDPVGQVGLKLCYDQGDWGDIGSGTAGLAAGAVVGGTGRYVTRSTRRLGSGADDLSPGMAPGAAPGVGVRAPGSTVPRVLPRAEPVKVLANPVAAGRLGRVRGHGRVAADRLRPHARAMAAKRLRSETPLGTAESIIDDWQAVGAAPRRVKAVLAVKSTTQVYQEGERTMTRAQSRGDRIDRLVDGRRRDRERADERRREERVRAVATPRAAGEETTMSR